MNDRDDFKKLLSNAEEVFGPDLWRDWRRRGVITVTGRTDTSPSQVFLFVMYISWGYVLYDLVIKNIGWLWGLVVIVPIHLLTYKRLSRLCLIDPLPDDELRDYLSALEREQMGEKN